MTQTEILKALEAEISKIEDPVERFLAVTIVAMGKSIAILTANSSWDMLSDLEQTIGALFVEAHLVKKQQQNQSVN